MRYTPYFTALAGGRQITKCCVCPHYHHGLCYEIGELVDGGSIHEECPLPTVALPSLIHRLYSHLTEGEGNRDALIKDLYNVIVQSNERVNRYREEDKQTAKEASR